MTEAASNDRRQLLAFGVMSLVAAGLTAMLSLSRATPTEPYLGTIPDNPAGFFRPFFGNIQPLLVIALVAVAGAVSLGFLLSRGWFAVYSRTGTLRGVVVAATIATLFAMEAVPADFIIRFPKDINVPPPQSLLFYPVIGYVVEVCFHALPLALLLVVLGRLFKPTDTSRVVWLCILLVSLLEPIVQMGWSAGGRSFSGTEAYLGLHLFAFNLLQLYIFRRYDFVSMYAFRMVYYVHWHIVWGYLRLQWLFG